MYMNTSHVSVCVCWVCIQVRLKGVEMEKRDAERIKRMEQELKEKHAAGLVKRKKAEARINAALEHNMKLMRQKRAAYEQREAEAEARRKEMEVVRGTFVWFVAHSRVLSFMWFVDHSCVWVIRVRGLMRQLCGRMCPDEPCVFHVQGGSRGGGKKGKHFTSIRKGLHQHP